MLNGESRRCRDALQKCKIAFIFALFIYRINFFIHSKWHAIRTMNTRLYAVNLLFALCCIYASRVRWRTTDRRHRQQVCTLYEFGFKKKCSCKQFALREYNDADWHLRRWQWHRTLSPAISFGRIQFNFNINNLMAEFQSSVSVLFDASIKFTA